MHLDPLAILVLVACALGWSTFDLARKFLLDSIDPVPLVFLLGALQAPLFVVWNGFAGGSWVPASGYWLPAVISVSLNIVSNVLFVAAIKVSPLSLTVPLLSFTPVFTALLAIPLLGEIPGPLQVAGIALVVVGALTLHMQPGAGFGPREMWRAFLRERGSVMMAGVALMWSISPPLDKLAVERSSSAFHGAVLSAGVGVGLGVLLAARGQLGSVGQARRRPWTVAGALAASAVALALQLVAIQMVFVSLVETVKRGLGNGLAVGVGRMVFREAVGWWQWVAVMLMGVGVGMILL